MSPIQHLLDAFPEDIRFVYRHFPLISIHDKANITSQAAEAAGLQGQFFEYYTLLYERAAEWGSLGGEDEVRAALSDYADELGLDVDQFEEDLDSPEIVTKVQTAYQNSLALGLSGAMQHLVGMKDSGTIIAVNKDEEAPIFEISDLGVVGDVHKVIPALIEALRAR